MQVAILRIVIVSLALLVGVSTAGADRGTARASSARPKARARISARSLPRIDSVKSGTGKLEAKLRSGRHKLAVTKDESATIRVERGTKAKVKYRLGRDGRIKSADITLNKSVEVRNGARAAASAMTRSRGFLLRTAARFTTAFVNPWVLVRKFKLTGDRRGGLPLTPH
ncbi:MAG: hypothetical protein KJO07_19160, partial [Deltaproteobacteria bacterium]|nr:hypothetical protein [Deltaproteobacteria bacterium]